MASLYEQLRKITTIVADTGDLGSIERLRPQDATTNPSLIASAAQMPQYQELVDEALAWSERSAGERASVHEILGHAIDRLSVEFGLRILELIPGRVSTEVDARLSYDSERTVEKARSLIAQYEAAGANRERVLIKIASTWEGIVAAERLEREGIHTNLTLLFGMHQAVACAEAGVTLISPFVGRILDYYKQKTGRDYAPADDPGVQSVTRIYEYFKHHGHPTLVMGASFRNAGEIVELAGCDLLTISPKLIDQLASSEGVLERKLDPARAKQKSNDRIPIDEASFRRMHAADEMASCKLSEGIAGFSKAAVALENLLENRLLQLRGQTRIQSAAAEMFSVYDLDGDGAITREEWGGTDAVFDALDRDGDGKLTCEELAAGLGAAHFLDRQG